MGNRLAKWLLTMLGFGAASCGSGSEQNQMLDAYGCPTVKFSIKTKVVDTDNRPIYGIKATATECDGHTDEYLSDRQYALSDKNGNIVLGITAYEFPSPPYNLKISIKDEDGTENGGLFLDKEVETTITSEHYVDKSDWVTKFEATIDDIVLERADAPTE